MKKEILAKIIEVYDLIESGNTIEHVISKLSDLQNDYYMFTRLAFEKEYPGYDGGYCLSLNCYRMETDQEEQEREERERAIIEKSERKKLALLEKKFAKKAAEDAYDRAELTRLKAKYGD